MWCKDAVVACLSGREFTGGGRWAGFFLDLMSSMVAEFGREPPGAPCREGEERGARRSGSLAGLVEGDVARVLSTQLQCADWSVNCSGRPYRAGSTLLVVYWDLGPPWIRAWPLPLGLLFWGTASAALS